MVVLTPVTPVISVLGDEGNGGFKGWAAGRENIYLKRRTFTVYI